MSWNHDEVQSLLAGHVLDALDLEDATAAERAMAEHVPDCDECREALRGFRTAAGEIGLSAAPAEPPALLEARLRRLTSPGRRRPRFAWVAVVAILGVAGMTGWNAVLAGRISRTETRQAWMMDAISSIGHPEASVLPLGSEAGHRVALLTMRGGEHVYVIASNMPEPRSAYQVWFVGPKGSWSPGTFVPERGTAMVPVRTKIDDWDTVMITEAPRGGAPAPEVSPVASALLTGD